MMFLVIKSLLHADVTNVVVSDSKINIPGVKIENALTNWSGVLVRQR